MATARIPDEIKSLVELLYVRGDSVALTECERMRKVRPDLQHWYDMITQLMPTRPDSMQAFYDLLSARLCGEEMADDISLSLDDLMQEDSGNLDCIDVDISMPSADIIDSVLELELNDIPSREHKIASDTENDTRASSAWTGSHERSRELPDFADLMDQSFSSLIKQDSPIDHAMKLNLPSDSSLSVEIPSIIAPQTEHPEPLITLPKEDGGEDEFKTPLPERGNYDSFAVKNSRRTNTNASKRIPTRSENEPAETHLGSHEDQAEIKPSLMAAMKGLMSKESEQKSAMPQTGFVKSLGISASLGDSSAPGIGRQAGVRISPVALAHPEETVTAPSLPAVMPSNTGKLPVSDLGPLEHIPKLTCRLCDLSKRRDLNPRAGFLLSLIDGATSLADILDISAWTEPETAFLLDELKRQGVIIY